MLTEADVRAWPLPGEAELALERLEADMNIGTAERGVCPHCGQGRSLTKLGRLRRHGYQGRTCDGSGQAPA